MKIVSTINEVREQVKEWKKEENTNGIVPTIGYMHESHASLIDAARKNNGKVVVSIFVNPIQFGPNEDLDSYPRDLEHDAKLCEERGVDLIFVFPDGSAETFQGADAKIKVKSCAGVEVLALFI